MLPMPARTPGLPPSAAATGATGPAQARPGGGQRALFWDIDTRGCLAPRAQPRRVTSRLGRPRGF